MDPFLPNLYQPFIYSNFLVQVPQFLFIYTLGWSMYPPLNLSIIQFLLRCSRFYWYHRSIHLEPYYLYLSYQSHILVFIPEHLHISMFLYRYMAHYFFAWIPHRIVVLLSVDTVELQFKCGLENIYWLVEPHMDQYPWLYLYCTIICIYNQHVNRIFHL